MSAKTSTRRRQPLTRDRVLAAAIRIADERGIGALTMRGLAAALGVEAMSLYHYAASKDEIVDGMVDAVVGEIELPSQEGSWKDAMRASAISAHEVMRRHPWACEPLMAAPKPAARRLEQVDAYLARLADADLPLDLGDLAYHAIDSHILGTTLWEAGYALGFRQLGDQSIDDFLARIQIDRYPSLARHAAFDLAPRPSGSPTTFEFGLDILLDGIERLRSSWPSRPADGA
jgi:AcrR family transcriptional regulator